MTAIADETSICPYLAWRDDPAQRTDAPDPANACYAHASLHRGWSQLSPFQQAVLCLTESHHRCTWLAEAVEGSIPTPPAARERLPVAEPNPFAAEVTGAQAEPPKTEPPPADAPSRRVTFRAGENQQTERIEDVPQPPRRRQRWWPFR